MGVVYQPGLAIEIMRDLAQDRSDDGINTDNLDDTDPDAVSTGYVQATERYRLGPFSPVALAKPLSISPILLESLPHMSKNHSGRAAKKAPHISGNPAKRDIPPADRSAIRAFSIWLSKQPVYAADVVEEVAALTTLFKHARHEGINPNSPSGIEDLVDVVDEIEPDDPSVAVVSLMTLTDYIRFCKESSEGDDEWEDAEEAVSDMLEVSRFRSIGLLKAIGTANRLDPVERQEAYAATTIVAMVPRLLDWIGSGRKVTPSGGVRRVDIAEAAAMLGVMAIGVNKLPPIQSGEPSLFGDDQTIESEAVRVMAMRDVPVLAAWWTALVHTHLIEISSPVAYPGPSVAGWFESDIPPMELSELLIGLFIADLITLDFQQNKLYGDHIVDLAIEYLQPAVAPENYNRPRPVIDHSVEMRVMQMFRSMEQVGLIEIDEAGDVVVSPELRGAVGKGILLTMTLIEEAREHPDDLSTW